MLASPHGHVSSSSSAPFRLTCPHLPPKQEANTQRQAHSGYSDTYDPQNRAEPESEAQASPSGTSSNQRPPGRLRRSGPGGLPKERAPPRWQTHSHPGSPSAACGPPEPPTLPCWPFPGRKAHTLPPPRPRPAGTSRPPPSTSFHLVLPPCCISIFIVVQLINIHLLMCLFLLLPPKCKQAARAAAGSPLTTVPT